MGIITVKLPKETRQFASLAEVVPFARELWSRCEAKMDAQLQERLLFGWAMAQVRDSIPHGQWDSFVTSIGLNRRTVSAAMRVAREAFEAPSKVAAAIIERRKQAHTNPEMGPGGAHLTRTNPEMGSVGAHLDEAGVEQVLASASYSEIRRAITTPRLALASPGSLDDFLTDNDDIEEQVFRPEEECRPGPDLKIAGGEAEARPVLVGPQLSLGELYELAADTTERQTRLLNRADTRDAAAAALREYHDALERIETERGGA